MKTLFIILCAAFIAAACTPAAVDTSTTTDTPQDNTMNTNLILHTTLGAIEIELYNDKAPITAGNFLKLAQEGYYDGTAFHRVIPDFMIQGGDPLSKDYTNPRIGTGGPDYRIRDEFAPGLKHDKPGILSMANSGPNTGGSQFFLTTVPTPWLDGKHAIFGRVVSGMDIVAQIEAAPRDARDKPLTAIIIERVEVKQ